MQARLLLDARNGNVNGVEIALAAVEDLASVVDNMGNNALHIAAESGHPEIVELLLGDGRIKVNAVNAVGETALYKAVYNWRHSATSDTRENYMAIANLLLNAPGIDPTIIGLAGIITLIHIAIPSPLQDISMLDMLLTDGRIDPTTQAAYAGEPIHMAVFMGNFAAVDRLLQDNRVDPTSITIRANGVSMSPIEIAHERGNKQIALRLLQETGVLKTITPEVGHWLNLSQKNVDDILRGIEEKAWARRRHAVTGFAKYWESRDAEGGKRTRRNKRRIGRRVNAIGGKRTRRNKRRGSR